MRFQVQEDARTWFKDLMGKGFDLDFDIYYFCFIAGVTTGRKADAAGKEVAEFIDYFPGRYRDRGRLLIALFLSKELAAYGVAMNEKQTVNKIVTDLTDPDAPSDLSAEGMREFNRYAHGGYDVLLEWFEERPRSLETFLRMFKQQVDGSFILE